MASLPTRTISRSSASVLHHLQRRQAQHRVEAVIAEQRQAVLHILLDHAHAALGAGQHLVVGHLDAVAAALLVALQVVHHHAIAAAEVQHMRLVADPVGDERQVRPRRSIR
jgi:hypothetical protein